MVNKGIHLDKNSTIDCKSWELVNSFTIINSTPEVISRIEKELVPISSKIKVEQAHRILVNIVKGN